MKKPDTAALRERLANYTPEEELKQDMQELDGLLQEVNYQTVELRNLLNEIQALKEELHGIHGSLKHTVQRERAAKERNAARVGVERDCAVAYLEVKHFDYGKAGKPPLPEVAELVACTAKPPAQAVPFLLYAHYCVVYGRLRAIAVT